MKPKPVHLLSGLIFISLLLSGFTAVKLLQVENRVAEMKTVEKSGTSASFSLPTGNPEIYGEELDVKYGDVSRDDKKMAEKTIQKFASYDSIQLSGEKKERYTDILYEMNGGISCEYCCEAEAVVTANGEPGCGCAHAVAMRGLTKYLLQNHGDEMTDPQIFEEVAKWKTRYFPTQTKSKAAGLSEQGEEVSFVNLASNEYRGVSSDSGGWVGNC